MVEEAIQILREKDSFAAIEFLSGLPDAVAPSTLSDRAVFPPLPVLGERDGVRVFPEHNGSPPSPQPSPGLPGEGERSLAHAPHALTAARAFDETMRELYWKQKDLDGSIAIGRAGVQFALLSGNACGADAAILRGIAKSISYNLASFTWPGWDEAGIVVTRSHVAIGLDAAKANIRLAAELDKGSLAMSRACWMLAAQHLAAGDATSAIEQFGAGAHHAIKAGRPADELLHRGFARLAALLSGEDENRDELNQIRDALQSTDEERMFASQLKVAEEVFNRREWAIDPARSATFRS